MTPTPSMAEGQITSRPAFGGVVLLLAAVAIGAHYGAVAPLHWLAKPATTLAITAIAWSLPSADRQYRRWLVAGLLLSTLGDVWLMLPGDRFVAGLASFLLAHLAYLVAFTRRARLFARPGPFAAYALLALALLLPLWPALPPVLRLPVLVYIAALTLMAAQAAAVWRLRPDPASARAALGGGVFVLSDALLAWDRFVAPFGAATALVLASYWTAQWLIARSVAGATASNRR